LKRREPEWKEWKQSEKKGGSFNFIILPLLGDWGDEEMKRADGAWSSQLGHSNTIHFLQGAKGAMRDELKILGWEILKILFRLFNVC